MKHKTFDYPKNYQQPHYKNDDAFEHNTKEIIITLLKCKTILKDILCLQNYLAACKHYAKAQLKQYEDIQKSYDQGTLEDMRTISTMQKIIPIVAKIEEGLKVSPTQTRILHM